MLTKALIDKIKFSPSDIFAWLDANLDQSTADAMTLQFCPPKKPEQIKLDYPALREMFKADGQTEIVAAIDKALAAADVAAAEAVNP